VRGTQDFLGGYVGHKAFKGGGGLATLIGDRVCSNQSFSGPHCHAAFDSTMLSIPTNKVDWSLQVLEQPHISFFCVGSRIWKYFMHLSAFFFYVGLQLSGQPPPGHLLASHVLSHSIDA
jgi:hypothetical protein